MIPSAFAELIPYVPDLTVGSGTLSYYWQIKEIVMPVNVICRFIHEPVNTHIWCRMQYSHSCHHRLKRDGVSKTLDWLLNDKKAHRWQIKGTVATIWQFYPYAMNDPRIQELAKRGGSDFFSDAMQIEDVSRR
jgi:hypothetical protein